MYIYIYISVYVCVHACMCVCMHGCIHARIYSRPMYVCMLEWPKKYFFARFIRTPCHFRRFGAKTTLLNFYVNPITGSGLPQPLKKSMRTDSAQFCTIFRRS